MSRLTRMRGPILAGVAGLAACAYVYNFDPSEPGFYPPCPFKALTGMDCPLCGSLRATHAVLHGDVRAGLDLNALTVVIILPVVLGLFMAWSVQRWRGKPFEVTLPKWATAVAITAVVAFTVIRNVPGMPWGSSA